jgi:two-component system NtrC family sensor kinase
MSRDAKRETYDFKGLGFSKIGHFKQVRAKIKELENIGNEREAIINNMSDGLTILDKDLNIVFANKIQQDLFQDNALIGKKCFAVCFQQSKSCSDCPALITFATEKTLSGELVINHSGQDQRFFEWSTSYIKDPSGCDPKIILLMRDVTKRKEHEFELMRADRLAAIGLLVAGIAHEINNPLTSIAGFSESLLKKLKTSPEFTDNQLTMAFQEYLEIINEEAYRCSNIIRNLIHYSQESSDDFTLVNITPIIQDTILLIRPHAKDNGIQIILNNGQTPEAHYLVGNESHLKHLFLNLFNYALEAMVDEGRLVVLLRTASNELEILISNMEAEALGKAVNSKERSEATTPFQIAKPGTGGTPLSLSVCYSIVQYHRGQLIMQHFKGSKFLFILKFRALTP